MSKPSTVVAALSLVVLTASGCGGASANGQKAAPTKAASPQPSRQEQRYNRVVLDSAKGFYPNQDIRRASCEKVGFEPAGDIISCVLVSGDGTETEPSDWLFAETGTGDQAIPQDMRGG